MVGFRLSLKRRLVLTHVDLAGASLFYSPFVWECVLQVALLLSPNPGPMQHRRPHISAAESSVTYYELLVANLGGSSFFLTLLFPGLLSHHNQKPAESIMRGTGKRELAGLRVSGWSQYVGSGMTPGA